jgi:23S rRNA (guanosine2251-2'-O)-methyltransferase
VGTGGHGRKALEGKGPTPKAEDRTYHVAYKRKQEAEKKAAVDAQRGRGRDAARGVVRGTRRATDGTEVIAGRNSLLEALRTDVPITTIYVAARIDHDDRTKEILELAAARSLTVLEASKTQLDTLTEGQVHQGVAAQVPPYDYKDVDDLLDAAERAGQAPLIVALDGVTDPRNLGAILRSAGAFGVHGVLVPERRAAGVTASAWKVSAGAAAHVPVARATNLTRALEELKKAGCFVVGLDGGGDTTVGDNQFATDPLVIVVGSEGKGMARLVREACDAIASIPINTGAVESLNASVATSIALYEVAKARA